jgi:hypothetical protein
MRFFLTLLLIMFVEYGVCHGTNAPTVRDLSFSVFLEINGEFIYPAGQSATDSEHRPFELCVEVRGLTDQSLERILLDVCRDNLGIFVIDTLQASIVSFLDDYMMTTVESCMPSSVASPVGTVSSASSNRQRHFPSLRDLLALNRSDLFTQIQGQSLKVCIQSPTESIYTVGRRLRLRELVH